MKPNLINEAHDLRFFDRSEAAQRILDLRPQIESELRAYPMKIWPISRVARLFHISESQLWKWIYQKVISTYHRPSREGRFKKGIAAKAIKGFLRRLSKCRDKQRLRAEWSEFSHQRVKFRERPAAEKCLAACRAGLDRQGLNPRQFAEAAGVSIASVHRMLRDGYLESYLRTPYRIIVCDIFTKIRKRRLTDQNRKKRGKPPREPREAVAGPLRCF